MIRDPGDHHHLHLFEDHRWAVAGAAILYLLAGAVFLIMALDDGVLQPLDDWWRERMVAGEGSWITLLAKVLDVLGGAFVTWPLRIGVAMLLGVRKYWVLFSFWIGTVMISEIAIGVLKGAYDRPRPPGSLVETTGASFPSGHSVASAATAVALVIVLLAPGAHRRIWEVRAGLFAFVMAMSRTYLRAHWLTDVIAGLLLGAATALALGAIADEIRERMGRSGPAPI
jgi:undecaprenyl-diphosphatase